MKVVNTSSAGLFGPYNIVVPMADRYRVDGADLPFTVVGTCEVLPVEVGYDFDRLAWTWDGTQLAPAGVA